MVRAASVTGELELLAGCYALAVPGDRNYLVVWPHGTIQGEDAVVPPSGSAIALGDHIEAAGGLFEPDELSWPSIAEDCELSEFDGIAYLDEIVG